MLEQEALKQTVETREDSQAVKQTDEITDKEAVKQTAEITIETVDAAQQMAETVEDIATVEVTDRETVIDAGDIANKPGVTQIEECREKHETVQYSKETLQAIEGLQCYCYCCKFSVTCCSSRPVGVLSIVMSVSVCLSVCLSVCQFTNYISKLHRVFCSCYL